MKYKGNGSSLQLSKSTIVAFIGLGVLLLLGVHAYLLQTTLSQNSVNSTVATLPDDASWPIVYTGPLRQRPIPLAKRKLQPLEEKDWNQYTIRINTWRRPEQLLASVAWHSQCPGVAQIQIIWCDLENEPPTELEKYGNVVIERHLANNLNERFNVLIPPLTIGILSIDDDVLRPCESIDAGFFKWTQSPDRMVGFDGRLHVEKEDGSWNVSYLGL